MIATIQIRAGNAAFAVVMAALVCAPHALSIEPTDFAGSAHGYPALRDLNGKTLAEGEFTQWIEEGRLHVRIVQHFRDGRRTEENGVLRQKPELAQDEWSWRETRDGQTLREFKVDFAAGKGTAQKREKGELKHWEEKLEIEPGRTFAGFAFTLGLQNLRKRLLAGERIELKAVGFTPKPQLVAVELSYAGVERMEMASRRVEGDHFVVHPKIPAIAKLFVSAPDTHIWLTHPAPAGFLRSEGPLAEPDDPVVRVDLLPGAGSSAAEPAKQSASD